jgi:hypothetical protein
VIVPRFAASGVAAKATAENAIVAATAIMEIVFMFVSYQEVAFHRACAPHPGIQLNSG